MLDFHIRQASELRLEGGELFAEDFSGRHVMAAAMAQLKLTEGNGSAQVPINELLTRREDMGMGRLQLIRQEDGDMCVAVIDAEGYMAGIEFCTQGGGGGRSPKVLQALYDLAQAIIDENNEHPIA